MRAEYDPSGAAESGRYLGQRRLDHRVHTHPNGEPTPSAEGLDVTRDVLAAGTMLGIALLDHLVIAGGHLEIACQEVMVDRDEVNIGRYFHACSPPLLTSSFRNIGHDDIHEKQRGAQRSVGTVEFQHCVR